MRDCGIRPETKGRRLPQACPLRFVFCTEQKGGSKQKAKTGRKAESQSHRESVWGTGTTDVNREEPELISKAETVWKGL